MKSLLNRDELVFNPPELGCVLYFPGLPGGGRIIYDRSPYGNTGTIVGATWVRLPSGLWVLSFDGQDDRIILSTLFDIVPSDFTLELWFNSQGNTGAERLLVFKQNVINEDRFLLTVHADERIRWLTEGGNGGNKYAWSAAISQTTWYHLTAIHKVGQALSLNLSGVITTGDVADTIGAGADTDLAIGANDDGGGPFKGLIALVRIHNRALSALEIQGHFNREKHLFGVW